MRVGEREGHAHTHTHTDTHTPVVFAKKLVTFAQLCGYKHFRELGLELAGEIARVGLVWISRVYEKGALVSHIELAEATFLVRQVFHHFVAD